MRGVRISALAVVAAAVLVPTAAPGPPRPAPCRPHVVVGVLPTWARGGFSAPEPVMPYVLGRAGRIAAILWADPLLSPPSPDHSNKILWVSHAAARPGSDLRISAQRMTGGTAAGSPVRRRVGGGPGPSIVDLPSAGCWRLTLRWSGRVDVLDLRYAAGP